ncbi:MAG: aldose 1-epimerase family protein [Streptosporangiaceae bacterium]|nr:aldose 1-epimerase family protein [Streptosporangiaceae bacterium]MBV9858392.1 aldose 1-epimerase family protein [Streptosporangiaceae bacterium]
MTVAPSGEQIEIAAGDQRATIVEVGGGIRRYLVGERPVLQPYDVSAMCDAAHGTPLVPWPNRLADGRYSFGGREHQLALTEPGKRNAIHGLLRWRTWQVAAREPDRVVMATRLYPMAGYPFTLDVEIDYTLNDGGLRVTTTAVNTGDSPCPYGSGQHPYLSPGTGMIDDCTLTIHAATRVVTDPERQLPMGREAVEGTPYDFRDGRKLGDAQLDDTFTDLRRDAAGLAWVWLEGADGRTAGLWADSGYPYLEIFTGDALAPGRRRRGLGVEPMTCAPNAFRSGEGLLRLDPGQRTRSSWGLVLS